MNYQSIPKVIIIALAQKQFTTLVSLFTLWIVVVFNVDRIPGVIR